MFKFGCLLVLALCLHATVASPFFGKTSSSSSGLDFFSSMIQKVHHKMIHWHGKIQEAFGMKPIPSKEKYSFCHEYDCPRYDLMKNGTDFEMRCYAAAKWVSTTGIGRSRGMFMKLFRYIQGSNEAKMKINMTVPVTRKMDGKGKTTMSFFIPRTHQRDAPEPTEPGVFITNAEKTCYYVRAFSGMTVFGKWKREAVKLENALKAAGLKHVPHTKMMITAGYDEPWKLFDRHNEVWLQAL